MREGPESDRMIAPVHNRFTQRGSMGAAQHRALDAQVLSLTRFGAPSSLAPQGLPVQQRLHSGRAAARTGKCACCLSSSFDHSYCRAVS